MLNVKGISMSRMLFVVSLAMFTSIGFWSGSAFRKYRDESFVMTAVGFEHHKSLAEMTHDINFVLSAYRMMLHDAEITASTPVEQ